MCDRGGLTTVAQLSVILLVCRTETGMVLRSVERRGTFSDTFAASSPGVPALQQEKKREPRTEAANLDIVLF